MIFGERIEQADQLYLKLIDTYPNQVGRYHSQMEASAKKIALDRYRSGEIRILVACRALDEGFDIPSANVGIVLSASSVERQRIQRLGRILRKTDDHKIAGLYYLYIGGSTEKASFVEDVQNASTRTMFLSYDDTYGDFFHPDYETRTLMALKKLKNQKLGKDILKECRHCFLMGMLRTDWLLDMDALEQNIKDAKTPRQQNYWICMKWIGQISH